MTDDTIDDDRVILTWDDLKAMGVPFSRSHIERKMKDTIEIAGARGRETRTVPNPDPFPKSRKLGWHRNSPVVWIRDEVLAYLRRHGVPV